MIAPFASLALMKPIHEARLKEKQYDNILRNTRGHDSAIRSNQPRNGSVQRSKGCAMVHVTKQQQQALAYYCEQYDGNYREQRRRLKAFGGGWVRLGSLLIGPDGTIKTL